MLKLLFGMFLTFVLMIGAAIILPDRFEGQHQAEESSPLIAFFTRHPYESAVMVPDIVILNPVTRVEQVFSLEPGWSDANYMAWSPDYRKLLITYIDYSNGFSGHYSATAFDITTGETEALATDTNHATISGSYSPGGTGIYFLRRSPGNASLTSVFHTLQLGGGTDSTHQIYSPEFYISDASWSPVGGRLAASGHYVEQRKQDLFGNEIFLIDVTRNAVINMTKTPFQEYFASWSQDGTAFAYISDETGKQELYIMDAKSRHKEQLTETDEGSQVEDAKWLPDGNGLIYLTQSNIQNRGTGRLILYELDSTQKEVLVEQWFLSRFDISPHGDQLAYTGHDIFSESVSATCVLDINTRDQWCAEHGPLPGSTIAWGID